MEHRAVVLHIGDNAVDDDQRLGVGLQAVQTGHQHHIALGGIGAAADGKHIGTKALTDERVDALLGGIVEIFGLTAQGSGGSTLVNRTESNGVHTCVSRLAGNGLLQ